MTEPTPESLSQPAIPRPTPLPRSVEALLQESRRLRGEADRLERRAAELREAIRRDADGAEGGAGSD